MTTTDDRRQDVLVKSVAEIRRLRAALAEAEAARTEPVAVVGMGCRMPGGATDPDAFWRFLRSGGDGIDEIPPDRFDVGEYYDADQNRPGAMYTRRGGFLADVDKFDAAFFGVSPREAASLDPQQRLLLEVSWEALEDAGIGPDRLAGTPTGVFVGVTNFDYVQAQVQHVEPAELDAYYATSNASTFAAGRLAYSLGLSGPALSVDTACSSSLVAVHLAAQSLRAGDCRTAVVGGVNVLLSPESFVVLCRTRTLSPDGRCNTFDASANGYVRSEGVGVVVLKRLSDAVADGDRVLAVIRGSAVNQDGRSSGITVPNPAAQQAVVRAALRAAGATPAEVDYVEAHGTGTPLGDPIELRALGAVFAERGDAGPLRVGSVKTNVGHLEPAAGIAGLMKVVLALRHGEIPPHRNLREINPEIGIEDLAVEITTELSPWPAGDRPRIAGVSSFGASGTNAHVIVTEPPAPPTVDAPARGAAVLTISARTAEALTELTHRYRDRLAAASDVDTADLCATSNSGRAHFAHRLAVVGTDTESLRSRLAAVVDGTGPAAVATGVAAGRPDVVFLFSGQGSQYRGMAAGLYAAEPVFRRTLDHCDDVLASSLDRSLLSVLDPATGQEIVDDTRYTQPALFAVEYALAQLWRSWGVRPAAVLGHSIGELVAACVAGAVDPDDGLRLAATRGRLMAELSTAGAMAAAFAAADRVEQVLAARGGEVSIAAVNGPESVVLSGPAVALDRVRDALAEHEIKTRPVATSLAFHSALMEPALDAFAEAAAGIGFGRPSVPLVSNVTGTVLDEPLNADYLRRHARSPVLFHAGMATLFDLGHRTFVEIGPRPVLVGMARRFAPEDSDPDGFLPSLRPGREDTETILESLGRLYVRGTDVDWPAVNGPRRRVDLPTYPFQRSRHWFTPSARPAAPPATPARDLSGGPLVGTRIPSPLDVVQYAARLDVDTHPCLGDCVLDGLPVVNVGVYLEAAQAAMREVGGRDRYVVEDCLVLRSLVLDPDRPTDAQLLLDVDGDRAAFRYYAEHTVDGERQWLLHARGRLRPAPEPAIVPATGDPATDADARLPGRISGAEFYRRLWRRKLYLGPSAQWVDLVWRQDGEAVARMRAPEPGESDPYLVHPGLTDSMLQVLFACLPEDRADEVYALVGIDRLEPHDHAALRRPSYCHAELLPGTEPGRTLRARVRLLDEHGRPALTAEGVYAKRAVRETVLREPAVTTPAVVTTPETAAPPAEVGTTHDPAAVRAVLGEIVAGVLRADPTGLDVAEPLQNLGLDSLMAIEVRDAVATRLGVSLALVTFLDGSSVTAVGDALLRELGLPAEPVTPEPTTTEPTGKPTATTDVVAPRAAGALPTLVPDPDHRNDPFPLTDLQQAYLVGRSDAFALGKISTYFFVEIDLTDLDVRRLESALHRLIDRHDMLRCVVRPDGTQQVLAETPPYRIATFDLADLTEADRSARLAAIHTEMRDQVLDAATWPMFDVRVSALSGGRSRLHLGFDALMMDAWSTSLLFREWSEIYHGATDLPAVPVTYRDYVLAARELEDGPLYRRSLDYWLARVAQLPPAPELPLAVDPATIDRPAFTHRSIRLEAAEWGRFKAHAQAAGVTPSAALCTAYSQVLAGWSRSARFTLNILFFNRLPLHPDVGGVVGNFTTTTLLEVDGSATDPFTARAARLQHQLWTDLEHSHVSGVRVLRELARAQSGAPAVMPVIFASTVNFGAKENSSTNGFAQHLMTMGSDGAEVWTSIRTPQVWLDHQIVEDGDAVLVNWDSVDAIFPAGLIDTMFAAYTDVLHELAADATCWHRPAPAPLPAAELDVRHAANATDAPVPDGLLPDAFLRHAAATPDRIAVLAPDRTLTYGELEVRSRALAHELRAAGVVRESLVGVVMTKGWEQVVAVLGTLRAGAAYVPIDAQAPVERIRLLLDNAGIGVVLTQERFADTLDRPAGVTVLPVPHDPPAGSGEPLPACPAAPTDLAYVIFTSGSTGVPKGVMIEHRGALNTVVDVNRRFAVGPEDRVLGLSALNFDLSVYDVFGPLSVGGALVLPEPTANREPARWARLVAEHGVTVWNSVPALMEMFVEHLLVQPEPDSLPLRAVLMSGDWIPVTLPDRIRTLLPAAEIVSLGGATEASIWSIMYPIGAVPPDWTSIPYGCPMTNQRFHVLDDAMRPRPVWVAGQLYIAGVGLARGYLHDDARTRAAFVRHPTTGERLYRTGDLGRYLPDGTIEFLGREDSQVKVAGHRVELGEVEAGLAQCTGVRSAAVAAVGDRGRRQLAGYVVLDEEVSAGPDDVLADLRRRLPEYLVPRRLVVVDALPLSANGKVDRGALPRLDEPAPAGESRIAPRDELEETVALRWRELFDLPEIDVRANFFDLGGNSLLAVRLMAGIEQHVGRSLPVSALFARPTVELLADALRGADTDTSRSALVPIRPDGAQPPLFLVHPVGGEVLCYSGLVDRLDRCQPCYALQTPDTDPPLATVPELAAHYVAAIRVAHPTGPYRLGGWSMGGVIALEMAARLADLGLEVDRLLLIDLLEPPGPAEPVDEAALLAWYARDLVGLSGVDWKPDAADLEGGLATLWTAARVAGALPDDVDQATFAAIVDRFSRNAVALQRHSPGKYTGSTVFFRGADGGATREVTEQWRDLVAGHTSVVDIPGDHYTMMRGPGLDVLAVELSTATGLNPTTQEDQSR